ncbi:MAG: aminoglycoside 6'-N-acetyltransferase [Chloroflexota bacterium]
MRNREKMKIIPADKSRAAAWLAMRLALWPKCQRPESRREIKRILGSDREAAFLALDGSGEVIGFAEVSTREYVDGCKTRPVGYLEGIYVRPGWRKRGVASQLVKRGEAWAAIKGCREMGSDTSIQGTASIAFHRACGFRITERQVVFLKAIRKRRRTANNRRQ